MTGSFLSTNLMAKSAGLYIYHPIHHQDSSSSPLSGREGPQQFPLCRIERGIAYSSPKNYDFSETGVLCSLATLLLEQVFSVHATSIDCWWREGGDVMQCSCRCNLVLGEESSVTHTGWLALPGSLVGMVMLVLISTY